MAQIPPPAPPPYSKSGPSQIELFLTCQPEPVPPPSITPASPPTDLEKGIYTLDSICENCGLIIANIPKCLGECICLSWTKDGCCGTQGGCDPEDGVVVCCTACSNTATTLGLVLRDALTCWPWKGARKWVLMAMLMMLLIWLVGRGRMW